VPENQEVGAVVVGAGPYGLAAATYLTERRVDHRVFGTPMGDWVEHMPTGMFLKSTARDSSIGSPHPQVRLAAWCADVGVEPYDKDGGETPIPLAEFVEYGRWFQEREVPELEQEKVARIARNGSGFQVELASGEQFTSQTVVVAVGTAPFAYTPPEIRAPGPDAEWACGRISHSADHCDLSGFRGKTVAVIGRGQSALETAVLLHESGAEVHLLVRSPEVVWGPLPPGSDQSLVEKLRSPPSKLGNGWRHLLVTRYAAAFRLLPEGVRLSATRKIAGPYGGWWLKPRFEGLDVRLQTKVTGVAPQGGGVRLDLADQDGRRSSLDVDHVIAATGYRVDVRSLNFLSGELAGSIRIVGGSEGSPRLSAGFESSVPGLFFNGLASAATFGPMMRFVCGSEFAGPRTANGVAARLRGD
jgi:FAD-dependent urate hydroxylase